MIYAEVGREAIIPIMFPPGADVHWETDNRVVLNEREGVSEKQELIYEVSWIHELGAWRRFLRSRRKVQN